MSNCSCKKRGLMDREPAKNVQRKQLPSKRYCVFILPRIYDFSLFFLFHFI
ncbi:hypothetical protein Hanom_Chr13g01219591 [Helianthus anomalus]